MGNLFADAIEAFDPRIDLAVVNSGALRQDIKPGTITKGDLISAFPFPNTVVMTKLKGSQVVKIFNHAAGMTNGILQVSKNAKYSFSPRNKAHEIWIKGKPLKKLTKGLAKSGGRNNRGRITVWWRGGGHKRSYRIIDFKRQQDGIDA